MRLISLIILSLLLQAVPVRAVELVLPAASLKQGNIMPVYVCGVLDTVTGTFAGEKLPFIRTAPDSFYALLAVDMDKKPGTYELLVQPRGYDGDGGKMVRTVTIEDAGFPVQKLTLPPAKVFPDSAATARIQRESALRNRKWQNWSDRPFWNERFIPPLEGKLKRFGHRRIINGAPRSPHTGVDVSAPEGTPVVAPADGRVLLTGDFFFTGNTVYMDHGLGMIGMFFHLSEVNVAEGEMVRQGQVIGKVGSTGRATGPHLHWGIRWRNKRINPASLLELHFD